LEKQSSRLKNGYFDFSKKICYNNDRKSEKGGQKVMDLLLMRALLTIAKYCA
jgi:hypothetical protein